MTAQISRPGSRPAITWAALVLAMLLAGFFALACLGGIINAAAARHVHTGASRVSDVILAVVSLVLTAASVRWAVHLEHRLRAHQPVAASFALLRPYPGRRIPRRSTRYAPVVIVFEALIFTALLVGTTVGAVTLHHNAVRSSFVQSRGVYDDAVVTAVTDVAHHGKYSTWYTSNLRVFLHQPVNGTSYTLVHDPQWSGLSVGSVVHVLVDPRDPAYAEFPGLPDVRSSQWIVMAAMAVVFAGMAGFAVFASTRVHRHRRGAGSAPPFPGMTT